VTTILNKIISSWIPAFHFGVKSAFAEIIIDGVSCNLLLFVIPVGQWIGKCHINLEWKNSEITSVPSSSPSNWLFDCYLSRYLFQINHLPSAISGCLWFFLLFLSFVLRNGIVQSHILVILKDYHHY
jgi:hypothetical protein